MSFNIKNRLNLIIVISIVILVISSAFLRFFKYLFTPIELEKITLILIPEVFLVLGLLTYRIWRQ